MIIIMAWVIITISILTITKPDDRRIPQVGATRLGQDLPEGEGARSDQPWTPHYLRQVEASARESDKGMADWVVAVLPDFESNYTLW